MSSESSSRWMNGAVTQTSAPENGERLGEQWRLTCSFIDPQLLLVHESQVVVTNVAGFEGDSLRQQRQASHDGSRREPGLSTGLIGNEVVQNDHDEMKQKMWAKSKRRSPALALQPILCSF